MDISLGAPHEFVRLIFFVFGDCEQFNTDFSPANRTKNGSGVRATEVISRVRTDPVRSSPPQLFPFNIFFKIFLKNG